MAKFRQLVVFTLVKDDVEKLPPGFMNVEDAATFLRVSDETIRRMIADGKLEAEQQDQVHGPSGWRWIIPTAALNRMKKVRRNNAP